MEISSNHGHSRTQHGFNTAISPTAHPLASLLDEESFLLMVFEHLVDYGLHDCRLVCWRWHEVCQLFPVKLKDITFKQLTTAVASFPRALSLAMNECEENVPDVNFFDCLSALHHMRSLSFWMDSLLLSGHMQPSFQSMAQLTELRIYCYGSRGMHGMIQSIQYLTNLTKLQVLTDEWRPPRMEPFVELKKIRDMKIDFDLFTDEHGMCFFPSLTNLTRLELVAEWEEQQRHALTTKVCFLF